MNFQIKKKPFYWNFLKLFFKGYNHRRTYVAFRNCIYVPELLADDHDAIIEHEKVHLIQQKNFGGHWRWLFKYLFDKEFRYLQEVPGYAAQIVSLEKLAPNREMLLTIAARIISGPEYGKMVSFHRAYADLEKWVKVPIDILNYGG